MRSYEESQQKFNFVCFRCGSIIKPGDMMVTISVSLETPTLDRSIECTESSAVSSLCFPCASVILSEAVVGIKKLMKPNVTPEEIAEEETDIEQTMDCHHGGAKKDILLNLTPNHGAAEEVLRVRCSEEGFHFTLQCSDGISQANSRLFTWKQIAQLLIAADPDMFGVLDEPLHQVFPESLERLGYHVPNWQD